MKLILCYPPQVYYSEKYGQGKRWFPLGIAYLGSYIDSLEMGIDIKLLDLFEYNEEQAYKKIVRVGREKE